MKALPERVKRRPETFSVVVSAHIVLGAAPPWLWPALVHRQKMVSFLGPCAPNTNVRSMSPVRLGPVMNEIMLG